MTMPEQPFTWNQANHPLSEQVGRLAALYASREVVVTRPSLDELPGVRDYDTEAGVVWYEDGSQSSIKTAFARFATQHSMETRQ